MNDIRDRGRERDLVLAPNEFAFIADETKGNINVYVGPHKTSLANTDQPVVFHYDTKRFARVNLEQATQVLSVSPEGWYLVLKNPAKDKSHPRTGALNNLPDLDVGRKVNIPGPVSFALWPGQMVKVVPGHSLRSNQYLVVRVYDEEAAKSNWAKAVIKRQTQSGAESVSPEGGAGDGVFDPTGGLPELTMGKHLVIRGTDVSFYIPPTGVEIVADEEGHYVRDAATLERLEYCILLDEDGNKRFIQGPAVVFPRPTETFIERNGGRKFRAIELTEISGVYVKVIAPYEDETGSHKVGAELFITGKEQMMYFPRTEHALIRYAGREIHYGVAIPAGEARYVLDRMAGNIRLERGPTVFLPDPRREVIVRRVLEPRTVELLFPGNRTALEYNMRLSALKRSENGAEYVVDDDARQAVAKQNADPAPAATPVDVAYAGDAVSRNQTFSPPRTIVIDTRFEGAVSIDLWSGYAVMVKSRSGARRVVLGPSTFLLEYDETMQAMDLSTGTPKTDDKLQRTAYLRVKNNKVSDLVEAETSDLVKVYLRLSYRVDFEGDPNLWFGVENYVRFLTDHLRSVLRSAVKQRGVEEFYANAASLTRDVILGVAAEDGKRPGRRFVENGMRVYDVEVLDVKIGDEQIAELLVEAQHATVQQALTIASEKRKLELTRIRESTRQESASLEATTKLQLLGLEGREVESKHAVDLSRIRATTEADESRWKAKSAVQSLLDAVSSAELSRERLRAQFADETTRAEVERFAQKLDAEVRAVSEKAKAISPELIAALQAFGDKALAEKMAESMAPLAILGGESVADVLGRLLAGTSIGHVLAKALPAKTQTE